MRAAVGCHQEVYLEISLIQDHLDPSAMTSAKECEKSSRNALIMR